MNTTPPIGSTPPAPARRASPAPPAPSPLDFFLPGSHYAAAASTFYWQDVFQRGLAAMAPPLEGQPKVRMERPLVFVPGWGGWEIAPERFQPVWDHLTADGGNGGRTCFVRDGRFFADRQAKVPLEPGEVGRDSRVFAVVFTNPHAPPDQCARELARSLEAIRSRTGQDPDVEAYSLGGLITRLYLDQGGSVGRLMLLGTPNQGTPFARMAADVLRRDIGWATGLAGLTPADLPALEFMRPESEGLQGLNRGWERQRRGAEEVSVVGSSGMATPSGAWGWLLPTGDGVVEAGSLGLPGTPEKVLYGTHHLHLPADPRVQEERIRFFGWRTEG